MDSPATSVSSPVTDIGASTFYVPAGVRQPTSPSPPSSPSLPSQVASSPPSSTKSLSDFNGSKKQCPSPPHVWPCGSPPSPHPSHDHFLEDLGGKHSGLLSKKSQAQQQDSHQDENGVVVEYRKESKCMANGRGGRDHQEALGESLPERIVQGDVPSPAVLQQNSLSKNLPEPKKTKKSDSACVLNGEKNGSAHGSVPSAAFCSAASFPLLQSRSGSDSSLSFNETSRGVRGDLSSSSSPLLFSRSSSFPTGFRQGEEEQEGERKCDDDEADVSCELNKKEEGSSVTRTESSSSCSVKGRNRSAASDMSMVFLNSRHGDFSDGFRHASSPCSPTPLSGEAGTVSTDNNGGGEEEEQEGDGACVDSAETAAVYNSLLAGLERQDQQAKNAGTVEEKDADDEGNDPAGLVHAAADGRMPSSSSSSTRRHLEEEEEAMVRVAGKGEEGRNERDETEEGQPQEATEGGGRKSVSIGDDKNEARESPSGEGGEEKKPEGEVWSCRRDVRGQEERFHDEEGTRAEDAGEEEDVALKLEKIDESMDFQGKKEEQQSPQGDHETQGPEQAREREEIKRTISSGVYTPSSNCLSPPIFPRGHSPISPPSSSPARSSEENSRQSSEGDVEEDQLVSSACCSSSSSAFSPPFHRSFSEAQEAWQSPSPAPSFLSDKEEVKALGETLSEKHEENLVRFSSPEKRGCSVETSRREEEEDEQQQSSWKGKERRDERSKSNKSRAFRRSRGDPPGTTGTMTFGVIMSENFLPCFSRKALPQGRQQGCDYFLRRLKRVLSTRTFPWNDVRW